MPKGPVNTPPPLLYFVGGTILLAVAGLTFDGMRLEVMTIAWLGAVFFGAPGAYLFLVGVVARGIEVARDQP
ncbi:hypothetical protein [Nocardioides daphniae]|uniref:DUF4175 domain-containing protein n=1 Tax=Nocardioides daphniae TaxID=402297 RepID=A0A4P7UB73_9ACTN|nr:hypothetical protein [Nocardioides daphniae]QCC76508.1 hypothetical protein E2C04_03450 [Nocardioides daphniae]GGD06052.1 hypothetical protein GCM10007231_00940 [Nocardioides daphniae]